MSITLLIAQLLPFEEGGIQRSNAAIELSDQLLLQALGKALVAF